MEQWEEQFFTDSFKLGRLYRSCMQRASHELRLAPNEISVLLFLSRHAPQQDTATDIAAAHGISKALVTRCVDNLHRRGLLDSERDTVDRRIVHLRLGGEGSVVADELVRRCGRMARQLHEGVAQEELETVHRIMQKMQHNLDALLEDMESQVSQPK